MVIFCDELLAPLSTLSPEATPCWLPMTVYWICWHLPFILEAIPPSAP